MTIQFSDLWDVKEFMLMVDIYQWCDKQVEWGGLGYSMGINGLLEKVII